MEVEELVIAFICFFILGCVFGLFVGVGVGQKSILDKIKPPTVQRAQRRLEEKDILNAEILEVK